MRYQRMRGRNIAYPMGWDDNGLPTERRVQNVFGIRPNPALPYDPSWKPRRDRPAGEPPEEVSRLNFIEACSLLTLEDERAFEETWRELGLSIDWSLTYATIDGARARCRSSRSSSSSAPGAATRRRADDVGRRLQDRGGAGRDRGSPAQGRLPRPALRDRGRRRGRDLDHAARAARRLRGAGRASRRRALPRALRQDARSRRSTARRCRSCRPRTPIPRRAPAS